MKKNVLYGVWLNNLKMIKNGTYLQVLQGVKNESLLKKSHHRNDALKFAEEHHLNYSYDEESQRGHCEEIYVIESHSPTTAYLVYYDNNYQKMADDLGLKCYE